MRIFRREKFVVTLNMKCQNKNGGHTFDVYASFSDIPNNSDSPQWRMNKWM